MSPILYSGFLVFDISEVNECRRVAAELLMFLSVRAACGNRVILQHMSYSRWDDMLVSIVRRLIKQEMLSIIRGFMRPRWKGYLYQVVGHLTSVSLITILKELSSLRSSCTLDFTVRSRRNSYTAIKQIIRCVVI